METTKTSGARAVEITECADSLITTICTMTGKLLVTKVQNYSDSRRLEALTHIITVTTYVYNCTYNINNIILNLACIFIRSG